MPSDRVLDHTKWWNPFKKDTMKAVTCYEPETEQDVYIRMLAEKFGEPVPDTYVSGAPPLYNCQVHGSSNTAAQEHEMDRAERGVRLYVPEWVTHLEGVFDGVKSKEVDDAFKRGKAHGKNLLQQLALGDMTVTNFEDHRS